MSEVHVFTSELNLTGIREALAGQFMAELGNAPQEKLAEIVAHNAKVQAEIEALNGAVKGEKDEVKRMIMQAGVEALVEKRTATLISVPTLESLAASMLKSKIDAVIAAMKLVEGKVTNRKPGGNWEGKFENRWAVELKVNGGVKAVEFRKLSDAQKAAHSMTAPGQWLLTKADGTQLVDSAQSPNQLIKLARTFAGLSNTSPINNDSFTNGVNLSDAAVAAIA